MILKISAETAPSNCVTYDISTAQFSMPNLHFFGANLMHFLVGKKVYYRVTGKFLLLKFRNTILIDLDH